MTFEELKRRWDWKPIPHCPGRFVLSRSEFNGPPREIAGRGAEEIKLDVANAQDPVVIVKLDDGGLISYKKGEGDYLHTLNTSEGFERKLAQLGIPKRGAKALKSTPRPAESNE